MGIDSFTQSRDDGILNQGIPNELEKRLTDVYHIKKVKLQYTMNI